MQLPENKRSSYRELGAIFDDHSILQYFASLDKVCKIRFAGDALEHLGHSIGFQKGSIWRNKVTDLIIRYQDN